MHDEDVATAPGYPSAGTLLAAITAPPDGRTPSEAGGPPLVDLEGAYLGDCDLSGAELTSAHLGGADLRRARLTGAVLRAADLSGARLVGAVLESACLEGADLSDADLSRADLRGARLEGALLDGADLRTCLHLTAAQLLLASPSSRTLLPPGLAEDAAVAARAAAVDLVRHAAAAEAAALAADLLP